MLLSTSVKDLFVPFFGLLYSLVMNINAFFYNLVNFAYKVFLSLASAQIFTTEQYQNLAQKIYLVLGVVSLFFVAYALLRAIIDPDNAGKGEFSAGKIIGNLLKVIILLAFTPTIFNMAYTIQNVILMDNIVPKIVLGESFDESNVSTLNGGESFDISSAGMALTNEMFTDFITNDAIDNARTANDETTLKEERSKIVLTAGWTGSSPCNNYINMCNEISGDVTYQSMYEVVNEEKATFNIYSNLGESIAKDKLTYNYFLQLAVGLFMLYTFVSFSIDMGVRVVKLAYYQIIAPIPILTLIIPKQKKIFDNWMSGALSTYAEVFIRLAIVMLGMVLIQSLPSDFSSILIDSASTPMIKFFVRLFLIIGILIFMKQAPKLISDMFGLKAGSFKLGIGDKLSEMALVGGYVNKARGAVSGSIGAGFTSKMNGGSFLGGAAYGLASGWKDGKKDPHQFNAQRQGLYTTLGYKGKAGIFGGQAFMDKWVDDTRNSYTDDYKDRVLSTQINNQTNYNDKDSAIHKYYAEEIKKRETEYNKQNKVDQDIYDAKKVQLDALQAQNKNNMDKEQNSFDSQKSNQIANLNTQLGDVKARLVREGKDFINADEVKELQKKISDISNVTFEQTASYKKLKADADLSEQPLVDDMSKLEKDIQARNNAMQSKTESFTTHVYNPDNKQLEEHVETNVMSKMEKDAYKQAIKNLEDADETFKNRNKVYNSRIREKDTNDWMKGEEAQHMAAIFGKNMEEVIKKQSHSDSGETKNTDEKK